MRTPLVFLTGTALISAGLIPANAQAGTAAEGPPSASAVATPIDRATANRVRGAVLTWPISQCAFDRALPACGSLTETQSVEGRVVRDDAAGGWVFSGGRGTYDTATGAATMTWTGSVTIGNTNRGNYAITFTAPTVAVDGSGAGELTADVTYRIGAGDPITTSDVTIATFTDGTPSDDMSATPEAFDSEFTAALDPQLISWFTQTGSPSDPLKLPGAVSMAFEAWQPRLTVTTPGGGKPSVQGKAITVVIRGTGFDPAARTNAGAVGIYVNFGPNPATTENGYTDPTLYYATKYLATSPNDNGRFKARLKVKGRYVTDAGISFDGRQQPLGISTWAAHSRSTTAYDAFARIAFRR